MGLNGVQNHSQSLHKFIRVVKDQDLRWGQQADSLLTEATKWTLAFPFLARPSARVGLQFMWELYVMIHSQS